MLKGKKLGEPRAWDQHWGPGAEGQKKQIPRLQFSSGM